MQQRYSPVSNGTKQVVRCSPHYQFEFQTVTGVVRGPMVIVENPGWPGYVPPPEPRLTFEQAATLVYDPPTRQDKWRVGFWIHDESTQDKPQSQQMWSPLIDPSISFPFSPCGSIP